MVNAVRWAVLPVYTDDGKEEGNGVGVLVSGAGDKTLQIWIPDEIEGGRYREGKREEVGGSVNDIAISGISERADGEKGVIIAAASADGAVGVWRVFATRSNVGMGVHTERIQTITTRPKFFPLTVAVKSLPSSQGQGKILAVSGSTTAIQIYVSEGVTGEFVLRATLTGHENWVRSLAFTHETPGDTSSDLLLASASQDKYIRLWRVHMGADLPAPSKTSMNDTALGGGLVGRSMLSNKAHRFSLDREGLQYSVTFEALLMGHEDWILTARVAVE